MFLSIFILAFIATQTAVTLDHQYAIDGRANYNVSSTDDVAELLNQPLYARVICPTVHLYNS